MLPQLVFIKVVNVQGLASFCQDLLLCLSSCLLLPSLLISLFSEHQLTDEIISVTEHTRQDARDPVEGKASCFVIKTIPS